MTDPVWKQESGWSEPGWKEPERRLTGIVLPSFDDPDDAENLDEFERDRRARAAAAGEYAGRPVPVVPSGPPPAWPPPDPTPGSPAAPTFDAPAAPTFGPTAAPTFDAPAAPTFDAPAAPTYGPPVSAPGPAAAEDSGAGAAPVAATARREFPRFIHGEFVLPADGVLPGETATLAPPAPAPLPPEEFDPLTAPVDVLESHTRPAPPAAPEGLRTALPSWGVPAAAPPPAGVERWERTPTIELPEESPGYAAEPVTAPPAQLPPVPGPTWAPVAEAPAARTETLPPLDAPTAPPPTPGPPTAPGPTGNGPTAHGPTRPGPTTPGPTAHGPTRPGPTAPQPIGAGPIENGPIENGPTGNGPTTPGPTANGPTQHGPGATASPPAPPMAAARMETLAALDEPTAPVPVVPPAATAVQPAVAAGTTPRSAADRGATGTEAGPGPAPVGAAAPRKGPWDGAPHPAFPDATARTFRILPIAADLLPLEIAETRHVRRVRRLVISGVVLVAALVVGWYGVTVHERTQAGEDRQRILDTSQDLTRQRHKQYDELTRVQADSGKIDERLRKVLDYDLSWSKMLASLRSTAAAKNVSLSGITASLNQESLAGQNKGEIIGTVTVTGKAPTKAAVAAYVDALNGVAGVTNPFPSDATQENDGVSFTIRVDITRAALGGRFSSAAPSASPSGSK